MSDASASGKRSHFRPRSKQLFTSRKGENSEIELSENRLALKNSMGDFSFSSFISNTSYHPYNVCADNYYSGRAKSTFLTMYRHPLEGGILKTRVQRGANRRRRTNTTFSILAVILFCLVWYNHDHQVSAILRSSEISRPDRKQKYSAVEEYYSIPAKIWQIFLPKDTGSEARIDPGSLADTASWLPLNPSYQ